MTDERSVNDDQLVAYAAGELSADQEEVVRAALEASPDRARLADRLGAVVRTLREDDGREPTTLAIREAVAAFRKRPAAERARWLEGVREVARLVFDSRAQPALAGFRGSATGRQVAFEADRGRLDLQITATDEGAARIRGAFLAEGEHEVGQVRLVGSGTSEAVSVAWADDDGHFRFDCRPGDYDLLVEVDDGEVTIVAPDVHVG